MDQRKVRIGTNLACFYEGQGINWFICFGTLLHYIRGSFNISQDIDLGIIGADIEPFYALISQNHTIKHFIKSNSTQKLLNLCYYDAQNDVNIDLFKWVKFKGHYWHTYDVLRDAKDGIPSKYIFKSMPVDVFERDPKDIKKKSQDLEYSSVITKHGSWHKALPEMPEEGIRLRVPSHYGQFLDIAYPDWATERPQFGVSEAHSTFETKSCKGLC